VYYFVNDAESLRGERNVLGSYHGRLLRRVQIPPCHITTYLSSHSCLSYILMRSLSLLCSLPDHFLHRLVHFPNSQETPWRCRSLCQSDPTNRVGRMMQRKACLTLMVCDRHWISTNSLLTASRSPECG